MKIGIHCYFIADILTIFFSEMFVEWSFTKHILFVQKAQFAKNIKKKKQLLKSYMGDEAETLQKGS